MYQLHEYLQNIVRLPASSLTSEVLYCRETDMPVTMLVNKMQDTLACYSYTLVRQGWLCLVYNSRELFLRPGDLYIYSPGFKVSVKKCSDDYHAICLLADEQMTLESPAIWNIVRTAYYPVSELGQPVIRLSEWQATHLWNRMQEIVAYLGSSHRFLDESLRALYTLFLLDLRSMMEDTIGNHQYSDHTADLFVQFVRLLPRHFTDHHDIGFYAESLHITPAHLSRIVRQVTGRTVLDHINQMLLMEASWLLQTTDLSLSAIADRLHYADQSSFTRFFTRQKGVSPKAYKLSMR